MLALALYLWLPGTYVDAAGKVVPLGHAARATFAMMAWMATWWMTEAVEIEVDVAAADRRVSAARA